MDKQISKAKMVLAWSVIGIIGVLITIISDFILLGKPSNAYLFFKLGTETMADIAQWRITLGTFLGVIALPFQILGLVPLYFGLKPAGRVMPLITVIMIAHILLMGVAFHMSYAYIGSAWKLEYITHTGNQIITQLVNRFNNYWKLLIIIILIEIIVSSIIYVLMVLKGNTLFPKWMALLNPICIVFYIFPFILALPAPIGGYIAPAILNLSTLVFISFTTVLLYKKLKIL